MSSKNVGAKSIPNDHYATPTHAIVRLYEACQAVRRAEAYLDPMADRGQLLRVILGLKRTPVRLYANELREECRPWLSAFTRYQIGDAFGLPTAGEVGECVVTNPAFTLFERTARHFRAAPVLALLGPSGYLSGGGLRGGIVADLGMPDTYLLPDRLAFVRVVYRDERGKTLASGSQDSQGSTWYVWHGTPKRWGRTMQLREPTAAEKRSHVPPTWVNVVRAEDWEKRGKKAELVRSGWEGAK
jgi:hypothetical protein